MFSYIRKINKLYNGGDGDDGADDGVYLFDSQTIAKWAKPEDESGDIPLIFSYN